MLNQFEHKFCFPILQSCTRVNCKQKKWRELFNSDKNKQGNIHRWSIYFFYILIKSSLHNTFKSLDHVRYRINTECNFVLLQSFLVVLSDSSWTELMRLGRDVPLHHTSWLSIYTWKDEGQHCVLLCVYIYVTSLPLIQHSYSNTGKAQKTIG